MFKVKSSNCGRSGHATWSSICREKAEHMVKPEAVLFGEESLGESVVSSDVRKVICHGKRFQVQGASFDEKCK